MILVYGWTRRLPFWGKLPLDPHCSSRELDILDPERQQLGDPQTKAGVRDHHCLTPRWHCLSQRLHLRHRQRDNSLTLRPREAKPRHGAGRHKPILDGRCEDGPQKRYQKQQPWDRSLTRACTCDGRTAASRMELILVPSMYLLIRERLALLWSAGGNASGPLAGALIHCDRVRVADVRAWQLGSLDDR